MSEASVNASPHFLRLTVIILFVLLLALGCTKVDQEILGVWSNVKSPEVLELKPDGTGVFTYPNSQNPPLAFSWSHAAANSYVLDVNFMQSKAKLTATVNGANMSIESPLGKEEYQRHIKQ